MFAVCAWLEARAVLRLRPVSGFGRKRSWMYPPFSLRRAKKGAQEEDKILEKPKELLPLRSAARLRSGSS